MKRVMVHAILVAGFVGMTGCQDRTPKEKTHITQLALTPQITQESVTLKTKGRFAKVNLLGEMGSVVYVNGQKFGTFNDSGEMTIELEIDHVGSTNYSVELVDKDGVHLLTKKIQVVRLPKGASIGTVSTKGEASALTINRDGTMFVAEQKSGVEIISIGFHDEVSSSVLASIADIDAKNVILSSDERKLYIQDREDRYHLFDISNMSNPKELDIVTEIEEKPFHYNSDKTMRLRVSPCGLIAEEMSQTQVQRLFLLKDKAIRDALFVADQKILVAHGDEGLQLYDITDPHTPKLVGSKRLDGSANGLSLLEKDGILFVANGKKGVELFNLDMLLAQMK